MKLSKRATILLTFSSFGAVVGTNVGAFPFIIHNSQVSLWLFGLVGGIGMLSNIVAMTFGGFINRYLDHRTMLLLILPLVFVSLGFAQLSYSPISFVLTAIFISLALGTMDLFMNAEGAAVEQEKETSRFSAYHGSASLTMAVFAILSSIVSDWLAPWCVTLFTAVPMLLAYWAIYKNIPPHVVIENHFDKPKKPLPYMILTFLGLAASLNVTSEIACIQWAGQLLDKISPELAAYSGLGVAFFGLCSGTMRIFSDRIRGFYGDQLVLVTCISTAIAGFIVLSFAPGFAISVFAFAAVGIGLSVVFPCLFSMGAQLAPESKAAALSYMIIAGGLPRIILPSVFGYLAQTYSVSAVFIATALVSAAALAIIMTTYTNAEAALVK